MPAAIFPGTFDPLHWGHLAVLRRAKVIFPQLTAVVLENAGKTPWFTAAERVAMLEEVLEPLQIGVVARQTLTVRAAVELGASVLVRGVRNATDWDYESALALANRRLEPSVETVFLVTDPEWAHLSSSLVKEMAVFGADLSVAVPEPVARRIYLRLNANR
jgi:pantetheine-phosphate adenylyltransferase